MSVPSAYLGVVLIWSTTPLAVKWSSEGPGFLFGALGRMSLATLLCLAMLAILRLEFPWHREARRAYLSGALGAYGAMLLIYWAAQYVPSGIIAVLFGLSPLITALFAQPLLGERAFTPTRLLGMLAGLAGLIVIFGDSISFGQPMIAGLVALCAAVVLQSLSLVLIKLHARDIPSLSVTSGALLIATPLFFLTWLAFDHHLPAALPARAVASIVYLGVIGSLVGFTLFFYVLKHVSAHGTALITLVTPVFALMLGALVNHEHLSARILAGAALVLSGLALHQWGGKFGRMVALRFGNR